MTNIKQPKTNDLSKRKTYAKVSGSLPLPNLVEIQTSSFERFVEEGIAEVFQDVYPIISPSENLRLDYVSYRFDDYKYSIDQCKDRDMTFSRPLRVMFNLSNKETGEIKQSEVFMGDFPWMTPSGTFIFNGAERVIVSQLVRSPGAYFNIKRDSKSGKSIYTSDIIPSRGTWLEFESDVKDVIYVRIDRTRKIYATVLLRALGITTREQIISLFGENKYLLETLEKDSKISETPLRREVIKDAMLEVASKLRPGELATEESARLLIWQKFFDPKRYDLAKAGRYKLNKKLGIYNRLLNKRLAEHLYDANGELIFEKETFIDRSKLEYLQSIKLFENGAHLQALEYNELLDDSNMVQMIKVYTNDKDDSVSNIVGTDLRLDKKYVTIPDIVANFSYLINLMDGIGSIDDIDHLGNRRVRTIGELLHNQFRIGLSRMERVIRERMTTSTEENVTPQNLTNIRPLTSAIKEFFASSQLSQFMDQTNPLAELTNKRRLSALGPGGLSRERAGMEVRDVHYSHYGRICPIETPEGPNIGLINNLATHARVNEYGFIETPYRKVDKNTLRVLEEADYLSAEEESKFVVAQANILLGDNQEILEEQVVARFNGENILARKEEVDYVDVSPKQIVSVATACIPFLENDDAQRALMGANMQRQAIPLLRAEAPYVGTGMEEVIALDSGAAVVNKEDGIVTYLDARKIEVTSLNGEKNTYTLQKFNRSNQGTSINHVPTVKLNQQVLKNQIIADGPAMENGELALGQNVTIAFMSWKGFNYEDAIIMSERLVREDIYTSIHIEKYDLECRDTKLGPEEITADIPNVSREAKANLDSRGIIIPGSEVKEGDILVGKITPKGQEEPSPEEKLLLAIFGEKTKEGKDNSLRVPHGGAGTVLDVKIFSRDGDKGSELSPGIKEIVRVYIAQKRKISEGDKMAGRHGNKGVISKILPVEDMPFLPDGTPIDIMLNPLGVPSRMNIGQVLEIHLGMAAKKLGRKIATPVFDGVSNDELIELMKTTGIDEDGKTLLYDGRSGEPFDEKISVGVMYMMKLAHMVDDKLHARATGPYSIVTQQPLGGKAQKGGQRFGEMEVWALEAYGAAYTLQEILTLKSDDMIGRSKTYDAIVKGRKIPKPGIPESFRVLQKELQSLAIDVRLFDEDNKEIDMKLAMRDMEREQSRIPAAIRDLTQSSAQELENSAIADDE